MRELKSQLKEEILGCFSKIEVPKKHKNHFCSSPCGHLIHPGIFFIGIVLSKKTDVLCNMMKDRQSSLVDLSFLLALHNILKRSSVYQSRSGRGFAVNEIQRVLISWKITVVQKKKAGHDCMTATRVLETWHWPVLTIPILDDEGAFQLRKADCACIFDTIAWLLVIFFFLFSKI